MMVVKIGNPKSKSYRYHNDLCIIDVIPYTRNIDDSNYRNEQKTKMAGCFDDSKSYN